MVLRQAELARRAEHAGALDAAELGALDAHSCRQRRAGRRHRHHVADLEILRAADDLVRSAPVVDPGDGEVVGPRNLLRGGDAH